ncbi:transporter [Bradyrhizobium pachyrhizi]|uniref:SphA family protein n=1 Tax=Bradyrhizobium pachyrhizi TaxID=280333 RepID=UPI003D3111E6
MLRSIFARSGRTCCERHRDQWPSSLKRYAYPTIGNLTIAEIKPSHIHQLLEPIWLTKRETANRVRGRIETIMAKNANIDDPDFRNPAEPTKQLREKLPKRPKHVVRHHFAHPGHTGPQNGIDFHFDWGASHFLSKQLFVGMVGYAYQQITDDFGAAPFLGGFRSRVFGIGPQVGYLFPIGHKQGYLNFKGYREFAAETRPEGWNVWLTFAISNVAPTSTVTPTKHSITK